MPSWRMRSQELDAFFLSAVDWSRQRHAPATFTPVETAHQQEVAWIVGPSEYDMALFVSVPAFQKTRNMNITV